MLTINCKYCNEEFQVKHTERERLYCSKSCQSKAGKKASKCLICKKEFEHYGERIVCSRKCNAKYTSTIRIAKNNPCLNKNREKINCLACGKEFEYSQVNQARAFCSLACAHMIKPHSEKGEEGDNCCQLCGDKGKHHIFITLCQKCYEITREERTYWEIIFSSLISGSKLVVKDWGAEVHIVNHNDYCLKYLIFFKDRQFSYHVHHLKRELWHCLYGEFECVIDKDYFIFKQGDKIEIEPNVAHQLQALKNSILIEVSTRDYPEDSIRINPSIN